MSEIDELIAEEDEEVETMTAAEVLEKLEEAWLNEKFSPDLLEAKTDLVDCMLEQITAMEENIRTAKRGDFKVSIHRMEIEKHTGYLLRCEAERKDDDSPLMSPEEFNFAKEYQQGLDNHLKTLALRHMPANLQTLNPSQSVIKPNLDSYVFLRINEDTDGVLVEEETLDTGEEIVDLKKNDQHIMRYKPISSLVTAGAVSLI